LLSNRWRQRASGEKRVGRLDFATIDANGSVGFMPATDTARIDYLGGLITGYSQGPY
jgi:hypothetical protein